MASKRWKIKGDQDPDVEFYLKQQGDGAINLVAEHDGNTWFIANISNGGLTIYGGLEGGELGFQVDREGHIKVKRG